MKFKNLLNPDAWQRRTSLLFRNFFTRNFIKTYYYQSQQTWSNTSWLGVKTLKAPTDLWIYQELIYKQQPDFIIEIGTYRGGSALYLASVCEMIGKGTVITVDISPCDTTHPRIIKIVNAGGSLANHVVQQIHEIAGRSKCLVILDSTHRREHVLKEMELYSPLVPVGGYMVVEDTCLGGNPVLPAWGDGPMDAVMEYIKKGTFMIDKSCEKFLLTLHPNGFLKRIR